MVIGAAMNRVQKKFIRDAVDCNYLLSSHEYKFINYLDVRDKSYELSKSENKFLNEIINKINSK